MTAAKEPQRILATCAGLETIINYLIAHHIAQGSQTHVELFMQYYADRLDGRERVTLLKTIVDQLGLNDNLVYPKFADDLKAIGETRNKVAHTTVVRLSDTGETVWWKVRKGKTERFSPDELNEEVDRVLAPVP